MACPAANGRLTLLVERSNAEDYSRRCDPSGHRWRIPVVEERPAHPHEVAVVLASVVDGGRHLAPARYRLKSRTFLNPDGPTPHRGDWPFSFCGSQLQLQENGIS